MQPSGCGRAVPIVSLKDMYKNIVYKHGPTETVCVRARVCVCVRICLCVHVCVSVRKCVGILRTHLNVSKRSNYLTV